MSLRQAVNDMCKQCIYDETAPGTWRQQVDVCTSPNCPLFSHRPASRTLTTVKVLFEEPDADMHQSNYPMEAS